MIYRSFVADYLEKARGYHTTEAIAEATATATAIGLPRPPMDAEADARLRGH
jgi:hypothetical protein